MSIRKRVRIKVDHQAIVLSVLFDYLKYSAHFRNALRNDAGQREQHDEQLKSFHFLHNGHTAQTCIDNHNEYG